MYLKKTLLFSLVLFLTNLIAVFFLKHTPVNWIIFTHFFLLIITIFILYTFSLVTKINISKSGFSFMGMILIKMILILFGLKVFDTYVSFNKIFVLNFVLTYLLYLFFTIFQALKLLKF